MVEPAIFLNHGGGPMPVLKDPGHTELIHDLTVTVRKWLGEPKAIILVTAHWETAEPNISAATSLLYDYYGFPKESYDLKYDCPTSTELADQVKEALAKAGIKSKIDNNRPRDHGLFIPMMLVKPLPHEIPVIQLSVLESQDASQLLNYGKALAPFREQGIAIIGSGMSFHNMRGFGRPTSENVEFERALLESMYLNEQERHSKLSDWKNWPGAKYCHPPSATEHFSPLVVIAGAGGKCVAHSQFEVMKVKCSSYCFE